MVSPYHNPRAVFISVKIISRLLIGKFNGKVRIEKYKFENEERLEDSSEE